MAKIKRDITTRRTPHGLHLYRATQKGYGCYGWGNTPQEARDRLAVNVQAEIADRAKASA